MISVVMPVYNEEKHLDACIQSIISQSFQEWELHAVDDFSTDGSYQCLVQYSKQDSRIHVHRNTEKGIVPALRLAFAKSAFPYISRMDADDKMHIDKLKSFHKVITKEPAVCVTAMVKYFADHELADGFLRYADWLNAMIINESHYEQVYKECVVASPCWVMHRQTIQKIGGICSGRYPEDYDLIFRLYEHSIKIKGIPEVLHYWRDHESRASRNDPHYADQGFIDLKLHFIEKLEVPSTQHTMLWGAGRAGKLWAKALKEKNIDFSWITDNIKKIGKDIYDKRIQGLEMLNGIENNLILIAIKSPDFYTENKLEIEEIKKNNRVLILY